ncbi:MAG TPA: hypothetical protein VNU95_13310 [Candidatus Acidoferrales bacterium]|jgi:hypothetical protein|nr:hypothetical protein [Candidatus Acidoferrales bacterium]
MSEDTEQFEQRLKRRPLRQAPAEWRDGILAAASEAQRLKNPPPITGRSFLSMLYERLASVLWPHPVAWGGLAAVWMLIFAVHLSIRDDAPALAEKIVPQSPEVIAQLQQQHRLLAELLGPNDLPEADRPKIFVPKPRSECTEILSV